MIEPDSDIAESYGILVGRTLVDVTDWSASVLLISPGSNTVVLPSLSCVGDLVLVSAVSLARTVVVVTRPLPEHIEDIVAGSHPSLVMRDGLCSGTLCRNTSMFFRLRVSR